MKKNYVNNESIIVCYHLMINVIILLLLLALPIILASIFGTLLLFTYFFLGIYVRRKHNTIPSFLTLPIVYTGLNLFVLFVCKIAHIEFRLPISLMLSYMTSPAYLLSKVPHVSTYNLVLGSLILIYFLPVIFLKLGSYFAVTFPNCFSKSCRIIGIAASKKKAIVVTCLISIILIIPVSSIRFSYANSEYYFGNVVYSYSINSNRSFTKISNPFTEESKYQKETGNLSYLKYVSASSNAIFEIPLYMIINFRGDRPGTSSEGFTSKEINWAWRRFSFFVVFY